MEASLNIFDKTNMEDLRAKSKLLTGYLELLLQRLYPKPKDGCQNSGQKPYVEILTPADPEQRGCQLSLAFSCSIEAMFKELTKRGVVCDERKPNVIRIAPVHLYNSFQDVHKFITYLGQALHAAHLN
ncbi:kynureninase-like [Lingula anatina]|uniref:Kynureninase-like n=1 Tax=Lingula anatina TaxID=7574 RepID=A0A2R2MSH7_LINAN|nr:kynureninase-like [Lingula anatina]|eukprot:XP_023933216.1 kynureninase-like [Lingula anatina]